MRGAAPIVFGVIRAKYCACADVQRYVPSRAGSIGTHNIHGGVITSNFDISSFNQERPPRRCLCRRKCLSCLSAACRTERTPVSFKLCLAFVWIFMLSVVAGIFVYYLILGDVKDLSLTLGDQYVVTNPLMSTFCTAVEISSNQTFSAQRMNRIPRSADTDRMTYNMTYRNLSIQGKDFIHTHFRFIKGSNLTMYIYPDEAYLEIIFLKGKHSSF